MRIRSRAARISRAARGALGLGLVLTLVACRRDEGELPPPLPSFAPALEVDLSAMDESDTHLYVRVLQEGAGDPAQDQERIGVTYTGWLPDGTQFDSNAGREPLAVTLGKDFLIDGFMEGLTGLRPGEERQLVVPPALAYGPAGDPGVIPRNSWLVFRVRRADVPAR